jgi:hypothetical protein
LAVWGFLGEDSSADWLVGAPAESEDVYWLEEIRGTARDRTRAESIARYWFREFCVREDLVEAWAAYRLFLIIADRRCLLWCWDDMLALKADQRKEAFFEVNIQRLRGTLKDNEKKLRETFLNCKIRDSLAPWMVRINVSHLYAGRGYPAPSSSAVCESVTE